MKTVILSLLLLPNLSFAKITDYRVLCTMSDFSIVRFMFNGEDAVAGSYNVVAEYAYMNSQAQVVESASNVNLKFTTVDTKSGYKKMKSLSANMGRSGYIQLAFTNKSENTKIKGQTLNFNTQNKTQKTDCVVITNSRPRPAVSGSN